MRWGYLFRADLDNPGDWHSSPMNYLGEDRRGVIMDVFLQNAAQVEVEVDVLVIGGGALFTNAKFYRHLQYVLAHVQARHRIVWGVGFKLTKLDVSVFDQFDLASTRECNISERVSWVPCASAMHPIFNTVESLKPMHDFLVVEHFKRPVTFTRQHTRMINKPNHITAIIRAIAEHRFVITSSYHVAYWPTLVGRPCFVVGENLPSKFFHYKHSPVIASDWQDELLDRARVWPEARIEAVQANLQYLDQVDQLINTTPVECKEQSQTQEIGT